MIAALQRWSAVACCIILLASLHACVVSGEGYGEIGDVSYGVDFYEPYGYEYGGWGPAYLIAPHRYDGGRHMGGGRPMASSPAYRPAAPSRPMPSIPGRSRGR